MDGNTQKENKDRQAEKQRNKTFDIFSRNLKRTREGKTHKFLLKVGEDENVVTPRFLYLPRLDSEERLVKVLKRKKEDVGLGKMGKKGVND